MKIGIDVRFALRSRRGIGNYIFQLVHHLALLDKKNFYIMYSDCDDHSNILPNQDNFRLIRFKAPNYFVWEHLLLPFFACKHQLDILHCPANTSPFFLTIPLIITIHDVMYLKNHKDFPRPVTLYQTLTQFYYRLVVPSGARKAAKCITVSNFSKEDIINHLSRLSPSSVIAIYESIDQRFQRLDHLTAKNTVNSVFGISSPYLLALGAIDPRKNTNLIINTFADLIHSQLITHSLVLTGLSESHREYFCDFAKRLDIADKVVLLGFVSTDELVALYNCADLFLYPSLYEGFGVPPLEAMACGTPVITSNLTSIPEVVGDAAILINPHSGEEVKDAILKLLSSLSLQKLYIDRGFQQVNKFSWCQMARETLEVYVSTAMCES